MLNLNKRKLKNNVQMKCFVVHAMKLYKLMKILASNMIMCKERILTRRRSSAECV
jgi:hypothetical protein